MSPIAKARLSGLLSIVLAVTAIAQPNFTLRHTSPGSGNLWDIVEGTSGMVAVGTNGTILHSTDGDTWTTQASPTSAWLVAIAFAEDRYVAVGAAGTIMTSVDGVSWRVITGVPTNQRLNNIAYADGHWVVVGEAGTILTSTDAETWSAATAPTSRWLRGLAYVQAGHLSSELIRIWVATGQDGVVLISEDAVAWQQVQSTAPDEPTFDREVILPLRSFLSGHMTTAVGIFGFLEVGSGGKIADLRISSEQNTFETPRPPRTWKFGSATREAPVPTTTVWRTTARFARTIVIAGTEGSIAVGDIYGREFKTVSPLVSGDLHGSGFGQGALFVVGDDHTILRSDAIYRSRLVNISTRGRVEQDQRQLIAGAVITGNASKELLVRAAGPSLAEFGVPAPLANPRLQVFDSTTALKAENQDWFAGFKQPTGYIDPVIPERTSRTGAFAFPFDSKDSAIAIDLPSGVYTASVIGVASSGTALVEFYDADVDLITADSRLINLSTRGYLGSDDDVIIAGFTIVGSSSLAVLLRGIGPGLVDFGVTGVVTDPTLELFSASGISMNKNTRWSEQSSTENNDDLVSQLVASSAQVGAFPLTSGSTDAALIAVLPPGTYTLHLRGANQTTGEALVEVYELP